MMLTQTTHNRFLRRAATMLTQKTHRRSPGAATGATILPPLGWRLTLQSPTSEATIGVAIPCSASWLTMNNRQQSP